MSMEYIRNTYGVPAKRGMRVTAYGKPGVITGAEGAYIMVRLDGKTFSLPHHPTDEIVYDPAVRPSQGDGGGKGEGEKVG